MFKLLINELTNDEIIIRKVRESGLPIVIWGNGEIGKLIARKLQEMRCDKIVYAQNIKKSNTEDLYYVEDIDQLYDKYWLFPGFLQAYSFKSSMFDVFRKKVDICFLTEIHAYDDGPTEYMTKDWYEDNWRQFDRLEELFADRLSLIHLWAYLEAKVNGDGQAIRFVYETPQYFSGDFLNLSDCESLVDCGAYIGDTIKDFIERVEQNYDMIYAIEPDKDNADLLRQYISASALKDVHVINKGVGERKEFLPFKSDAIMSSITTKGADGTIEVDTIDNIVGDSKVTIIKMDIEGWELSALRGARNTIINNHPLLTLSAYHKVDDIYKMIDYISSLWEGYKYYFRCHKPLPIDAVLYAVPSRKEK